MIYGSTSTRQNIANNQTTNDHENANRADLGNGHLYKRDVRNDATSKRLISFRSVTLIWGRSVFKSPRPRILNLAARSKLVGQKIVEETERSEYQRLHSEYA